MKLEHGRDSAAAGAELGPGSRHPVSAFRVTPRQFASRIRTRRRLRPRRPRRRAPGSITYAWVRAEFLLADDERQRDAVRGGIHCVRSPRGCATSGRTSTATTHTAARTSLRAVRGEPTRAQTCKAPAGVPRAVAEACSSRAIIVANIVATWVVVSPTTSNASPRQTDSVRPGLSTSPRALTVPVRAGASRFVFSSTVSTSAPAGISVNAA